MNKFGVRIENLKDSLLIRSATLEDASLLTSWWNDGAVMAHAGFPNGLNQTLEITRAQIKENETKLSQLCIIEFHNQRIGEMNYGIGKGFAEIGIKICESEFQNLGLGTKLLQMLIDFLFCSKEINQKVYINKIILDTNLNNLRAQHVYEKIGFNKIGIRYDSWQDQLGNWQSSVDYELTREQYEDGVRYVCDPDMKEEIAKRILDDLPEWFGLPESTKEYIEKSREFPFFAYYKDGQYVGFIVLKETGQYTAEIYVMGVLKDYQHQKIGKKLFTEFVNYARNKEYEFIQVKTVDAGHYEEYDRTRVFYEKMGFKKFECFPTLWDEWNPCLVMVQSIKR
jgi:RimJ/RimL family protein N-acetyltransferase